MPHQVVPLGSRPAGSALAGRRGPSTETGPSPSGKLGGPSSPSPKSLAFDAEPSSAHSRQGKNAFPIFANGCSGLFVLIPA